MQARKLSTSIWSKEQTPKWEVIQWDTVFTWPSQGLLKTVYDFSNSQEPLSKNNPVIYTGRDDILSDSWGKGAPAGVGQLGNFSIRWWGFFYPPQAGTYIFKMSGLGYGQIHVVNDASSAALSARILEDVGHLAKSSFPTSASVTFTNSNPKFIELWYYQYRSEQEGGYCYQWMRSGLPTTAGKVISPYVCDVSTTRLTSAAITGINASSVEYSLDNVNQFVFTVPMTHPYEKEGYFYNKHSDSLVNRQTQKEIKRYNLVQVNKGFTSGGVDEYYPAFRGHIVDFDIKEKHVNIVCHDFKRLYGLRLNENFPNKSSYWNVNYYSDSRFWEPDGIDKPVAYDGWSLGNVAKDLSLKCGIDPYYFEGHKEFYDHTSGYSSASPSVDDLQNILEKQVNYGRPWLSLGRAEQGEGQVDDPYLYPSQISETCYDRINNITDHFGFYFDFDPGGYQILRGRNNPYLIKHVSEFTGIPSTGWTSGLSLSAIKGFYYDSTGSVGAGNMLNQLLNPSFEAYTNNGTYDVPDDWTSAGNENSSYEVAWAYGHQGEGTKACKMSTIKTASQTDIFMVSQGVSMALLSNDDDVAFHIWAKSLTSQGVPTQITDETVGVRKDYHYGSKPAFKTANRHVKKNTIVLSTTGGVDIPVRENNFYIANYEIGSFIIDLPIMLDGVNIQTYEDFIAEWGLNIFVDYQYYLGEIVTVKLAESGSSPHKTSASFNVIDQQEFQELEVKHTVVDGTNSTMTAEVKIVAPNSNGERTEVVVDSAYMGFAGIEVPGGAISFDFTGSKLQLVVGRKPVPGRCRVEITTGGDGAAFLTGVLDSRYPEVMNYYDFTPYLAAQSPCVANIMDATNSLGFGDYTCTITPTTGTVRLNAALIYEADNYNPFYTVRTEENIKNFSLTSNSADTRNDCLVIGRRMSAEVAVGEEEQDILNPNNPVVPFAYGRYIDINSIYNPKADNYCGRRLSSIIIDPAVKDTGTAKWLSYSVVDRFRKPGPSVSIDSVGFPLIELRDALAVRDEADNILGYDQTLYVTNIKENFAPGIYETQYDVTPYKEFASFQPKPKVDRSLYGDHSVVNIRINYRNKDGRHMQNPIFHSTGGNKVDFTTSGFPMYDPYFSDSQFYSGYQERMVQVLMDIVDPAYYRVSVLDSTTRGTVIAYLTNPASDNHWIYLDHQTNFTMYWDGVDQFGEYNRVHGVFDFLEEEITIPEGFFVHNNTNNYGLITSAGSDKIIPYGQFYLKIEAKNPPVIVEEITTDVLDLEFNPSSAAYIYTHLSNPTFANIQTDDTSTGISYSSNDYNYTNLMTNDGVKLKIIPTTTGRSYRAFLRIRMLPIYYVLYHKDMYISYINQNKNIMCVAHDWMNIFENKVPLTNTFGKYDPTNPQTILFLPNQDAYFEFDKDLPPQKLYWNDWRQINMSSPLELYSKHYFNTQGKQMTEVELKYFQDYATQLLCFGSQLFFFDGYIQDKSGRYTWCAHPNVDAILNGKPTKRVLAWQYWDDNLIARMKAAHTGVPYGEDKTATTAVAIPSHKVRDYYDAGVGASTGYEIFDSVNQQIEKVSLYSMMFPPYTSQEPPWLPEPNREVYLYGWMTSDHTGEVWAPTQQNDQFFGRGETQTATIRRPYSYDEELDDGWAGMKIFFRDMVYSSGAHTQIEGGAWKMLPIGTNQEFYNTSGVLVYFLAQDRTI